MEQKLCKPAKGLPPLSPVPQSARSSVISILPSPHVRLQIDTLRDPNQMHLYTESLGDDQEGPKVINTDVFDLESDSESRKEIESSGNKNPVEISFGAAVKQGALEESVGVETEGNECDIDVNTYIDNLRKKLSQDFMPPIGQAR